MVISKYTEIVSKEINFTHKFRVIVIERAIIQKIAKRQGKNIATFS